MFSQEYRQHRFSGIHGLKISCVCRTANELRKDFEVSTMDFLRLIGKEPAEVIGTVTRLIVVSRQRPAAGRGFDRHCQNWQDERQHF